MSDVPTRDLDICEKLEKLRVRLEAVHPGASELDNRIASLDAVVAFLHDVKMPWPALAPLLHIYSALQGVRDGHELDPMLVQDPAGNRRALGPQDQRERAACVIAVEVLVAAGADVEQAARSVARRVGERRPFLRRSSAAHRAEHWRRIVQWREAIGTGAYPVMESVVISARRNGFITSNAVPAEKRVADILETFGIAEPSKKAPS